MSLSETGAGSTGPLGRFSWSTYAWNRRSMPMPRVRSLRFIEQPQLGPQNSNPSDDVIAAPNLTAEY